MIIKKDYSNYPEVTSSQEDIRISVQKETLELIGKELHDNINQILTCVYLLLEVAESSGNQRRMLISLCKNKIGKAINEIRSLSQTIVHNNATNFHWSHSIEELINDYAYSNLNIHYVQDNMPEDLPPDLLLNILRIIQEQLTNIIKHANATDIWITIHIEDSLTLDIKDNGIGYDNSQRGIGIGLSNIKKRVEHYKGHMSITSEPGGGTLLAIYLPLPSKY